VQITTAQLRAQAAGMALELRFKDETLEAQAAEIGRLREQLDQAHAQLADYEQLLDEATS